MIMIIVAFVVCGCATGKYVRYNNGQKSVEVNYARMGDQKLAGVNASTVDPNGTSFSLGLETQESKGTIDIDTLAQKIAEIVVTLTAAQ